MMDFKKNNLDKASSPYLQQHRDNPVYWQEWSQDVVNYAKKNNTLIFVSVGYATCHWCHVMAREVFEDKEVAEFLNEHFVAIKVDREQRPDIDNYMMSFMVATQGRGGWPLNVLLSPELKPFLAMSYVPLSPKYGLPGFLTVLGIAKEMYQKHKNTLREYVPFVHPHESVLQDQLMKITEFAFDKVHAGFGVEAKFPPHNTLLFLAYYYEKTKDPKVAMMLEKTLEQMALGGLHDHLQGGFYRYCTDRAWTIPHFEKMLYDQAMLLWVYSVAYKILKKPEYKMIAQAIIKCMDETFMGDGLLYAAHDADTAHQEGDMYLWKKDELYEVLDDQELDALMDLYAITDEGNFAGKNHLIKKEIAFLPDIEELLLIIRKERPQPFVDTKIITSWNAFACVALLMSYRYAQVESSRGKALSLFKNLLERHYKDGKLAHSSMGSVVQHGEFLEDYAAVLLCATYVYEETGEYKPLIETLFEKLQTFYDGQWYENNTDDFVRVPAQAIDHPVPSSTSLAEMALLRAKIILGQNFTAKEYHQPLMHDFYNLGVLIQNSGPHIIHTPTKIAWRELPLSVLQLATEPSEHKILDYFNQKCFEFQNLQELLAFLKQ